MWVHGDEVGRFIETVQNTLVSFWDSVFYETYPLTDQLLKHHSVSDSLQITENRRHNGAEFFLKKYVNILLLSIWRIATQFNLSSVALVSFAQWSSSRRVVQRWVEAGALRSDNLCSAYPAHQCCEQGSIQPGIWNPLQIKCNKTSQFSCPWCERRHKWRKKIEHNRISRDESSILGEGPLETAFMLLWECTQW